MRHKRRLITIGVAALMLVSLCAVCATTSVTAQNSSGAPANGLDSGTAVCSWGAGRLDVFAKGTDGNLKHKWWDGSWHGWEDLSAPTLGLTSTPTAVSWGYGRIDVFARGSGGVLWHKWFDSGQNGWHDWESLGVPAGKTIAQYTAPAACSWGSGRLDIFIVVQNSLGSDGQLWQLWFQNGWHDWVLIGKPSTDVSIAGSPGALSTVSWGYPRVDIFVRGSDGALWQLWWKNGWQAWYKFVDTAIDPYSGIVASYPPYTKPSGTATDYYGWYAYAPTVCSLYNNRLDVFFVDISGNLRQKYFDYGWSPLYQVGGAKYISAAPSAVVWQLGGTPRIDIFIRSDDFALSQLYWAGGSGWHGWYNLGLM